MRIIAGTARNRRIETPKGKNTRPTLDRVRENLFNILQTRIPDSAVLDLFSGSGALSFEAISRGAARAVLCDTDRDANRAERKNAEMLGFSDQTEIYCCDWKTVVRYMVDRGEQFDLVFLDPPYHQKFLENALKRISEIDILKSGAIIVCERPAEKTLPDRYDGLRRIKDYRYGRTGITLYRAVDSSER